jgi:hypothetical protein
MSTYISHHHVPYVPQSVSVPLVIAAPLAEKLAKSSPDLLSISQSSFEENRINDLKEIEAIEIDAEALLAVIEIYILNMQSLFTNLTVYLKLQGQYQEITSGDELESTQPSKKIEFIRNHLIDTENEIRQIASDLGFPKELHEEEYAIEPAALFDACLIRLNQCQKEWGEQSSKAISKTMKSQHDTLLGSAADCLTKLCEKGVTDIISFDPTPQSQEDVFSAIYQFIEHPFSGVWPKIVTQTLPATNKPIDDSDSLCKGPSK